MNNDYLIEMIRRHQDIALREGWNGLWNTLDEAADALAAQKLAEENCAKCPDSQKKCAGVEICATGPDLPERMAMLRVREAVRSWRSGLDCAEEAISVISVAIAATPKPEQQEAPGLTDEELLEACCHLHLVSIAGLRAVIAADRAKRHQPDPAAAWRAEGFNAWRQTRAVKNETK